MLVPPEASRCIVVTSLPCGPINEANFNLEMRALRPLEPGEFLVRLHWLSVDPFMVSRLRAEANYTAGVSVGDVMQAYGVGRVEATNSSQYAHGDFVTGFFGMREWAIDNGESQVRKIDPALGPVQTALGVFGLAGITAYFGLMEVGAPKRGETVAVSAGVGSVGLLVGKIAAFHGCRTVAIVGSDEKVAAAVTTLGFDAAVNRRSARLDLDLAQACPDGVDVYFDNAGGDLYDSVLQHMNVGGRIIVCGRVASAHLAETKLDVGPRDANAILVKRLRKQGFLATDYASRAPEAIATLAEIIREGGTLPPEDVVDGIDQAPRALVRMLRGDNIGKQLVYIGPEKVT
ncbi:MAG: NADP-dependent oxidoreductase [Brevundimonas sp.]|uniref:NADP-dependent oxidoreductase n=1 Tax=Brevundimonas sp. TaxID=1871086 RepID=UPI00391CB517